MFSNYIILCPHTHTQPAIKIIQWGYSPGLTPSPGVWAPQNLKWQRFFLTVHKRKLCRNRKVFVRHGKIMFKNTKSKVQDFPIRKVVIRKYLCSKITNQKFSFSLSQKSLWDHSGAEPKSRDFYARALYRGWFTAEMLVISRSFYVERGWFQNKYPK